MATSNQKAAEVVKLYHETKFPVTVNRKMKNKYPDDDRLTKVQVVKLVKIVVKLVKRFEHTGSDEDKRHKNSGRSRSSHSSECFALVLYE